jgi:hypothetical protein
MSSTALVTPAPDVPIWYLVGISFSAVFPPGCEPDWDLVREVRREFHPEFVPLWMVREYRPPYGSNMEFGYYVLGRWAKTIDEDQESRLPLNVMRPDRSANYPFVGGYIYDQRTWSYQWPKESRGAKANFPEIARPFDRRTVDWMREAHYALMRKDEGFKRQWKRRQREIKEAEDRELRNLEEEARLRLKDDNEATKAIKEGTLDKVYQVEVSTPHVQAERVMEGTELVKEQKQ